MSGSFVNKSGRGPGVPVARTGEIRMQPNRGIAVATGIAFIVATVGSIASAALLAPILGAPDYLARIAANQACMSGSGARIYHAASV